MEGMSVGELQKEFQRRTGKPQNSRNKEYLRKKIASLPPEVVAVDPAVPVADAVEPVTQRPGRKKALAQPSDLGGDIKVAAKLIALAAVATPKPARVKNAAAPTPVAPTQPSATMTAAERIKLLHSNGTTLRGICALLNAEGVPTARGGEWRPSSVQSVLGRRWGVAK